MKPAKPVILPMGNKNPAQFGKKPQGMLPSQGVAKALSSVRSHVRLTNLMKKI